MTGRANTDAPGARHRAALLDEIGAFLLRHSLAINGQNLGHAFAIVSGDDSRLARLVSARECAGEAISQKFLDANARPVRQDAASLAELRQLTSVLESSVRRFIECSRSAHEAASEYGDELQRSVDAVAAAPRAQGKLDQEQFGEILTITRNMVKRTREIELHMKAGEAEVAKLRSDLEKARAEASSDPLTGLPNRRAFGDVFRRQRALATVNGTPLTLAICDIDFFKRVNDRHGHDTGDRVIRAVATALDAIADTCHVARHGGEEFVLLFYGEDVASAARTLDAVRESFSQRRLVDRTSHRPIGCVTFSGGVADALAAPDMEQAMRQADDALYRAKAEGRNRIVRSAAG